MEEQRVQRLDEKAAREGPETDLERGRAAHERHAWQDAYEFLSSADAVRQARQPEQAPDHQAADREREPPQEPELPVQPEGAELELGRRGRPVAAARGMTARVATRDRRAVEGSVERLLVEAEPAAQGAAGAAAPGRPSAPSTTPGAWPTIGARWSARPSKTGSDSSGKPASAQARHVPLSRWSEASER